MDGVVKSLESLAIDLTKEVTVDGKTCELRELIPEKALHMFEEMKVDALSVAEAESKPDVEKEAEETRSAVFSSGLT